MGQYFLGYIENSKNTKVFDNHVDGEYNGLKLMEHSWFENRVVGNVVNAIFYKKAHVCWVGDYYDEDNYSQVNCNPETVKKIGDLVWGSQKKKTKSSSKNTRFLFGCLLINHTKKIYIDCSEYYEKNKTVEEWGGQKYYACVHPLPLLTCSDSHGGGSYYGINKEECGTWFNDELEVVLWQSKYNDYTKVEYEFRED